MDSITTISFTVVEGQVMYNVSEKIHLFLQLLSDMQQKHIQGSLTVHTDKQGNVKIEQKSFF